MNVMLVIALSAVAELLVTLKSSVDLIFRIPHF